MCTVFLLYLCVTGLPLIFHEEIEHLLEDNKEALAQNHEKLSLDKLVKIAESKYPGEKVSLIKEFSVIAGVSYNDMKYTEADETVIGRRPATASSPWLVNFNASYQFLDGKLKGLGFGVGGNYASNNKIVNSTTMGMFILPKYLVLNANAFYDTKKYRIGVKVDNFTNEHYWSGYTIANAQALANILGSFTYKF
ncbi:hypothetical protein DRF65_17460 [Chryseobacterium pennae]|uniref:TonB-dependent receptor-like beta-barrel domain-containing protein n=1 Tax=Chryseobacterium pennae TaxID=2258962 RepID=A0A3D9C6B3_9FLAO|nr:hypothetical protein DRF65_17460 [Chryseobacterium pennae]